MKKIFYSFTICIFLLALSGCGKSIALNTKTSYIYPEVVSCEEHFYLNYSYESLARKYADNYYLHHYYTELAIQNGYYEYYITVIIDEKNYKFIREEQANVGDTIEVTKIETFYNLELIDVEYKIT